MKLKVFMSGIIGIIFVYIGGTLPVFSYTFLTNLRVGDKSVDVKELQIVLNSNVNTKIAESGPGSPGNETNYFGNLTKNAVIKFQDSYHTEILLPAGLSSPTGYVGALTRLKLNSLFSKQSVDFSSLPSNISIPAGIDVPVPANNKSISEDLLKFTTSLAQVKPVILGLSRYEAKQGDLVVLRGQGLLSVGNKIHFGNSETYATGPSDNGFEVHFKVPESIPYGSYYLWVENGNGSSFVENGRSFFNIVENPHEVPLLASVSPKSLHASAVNSTKIVLTGANFTPQGNDIYSNLGILENIPSLDGKTLEFSLSSFTQASDIYTLKNSVSSGSIVVHLIMKTDYGFSSEPAYLVIEF